MLSILANEAPMVLVVMVILAVGLHVPMLGNQKAYRTLLKGVVLATGIGFGARAFLNHNLVTAGTSGIAFITFIRLAQKEKKSNQS